jgi:acetyl-CoA acetyltransferase
LLSYTINYQPWIKSLTTPYVIAIVAPKEAKNVHITTALVDISPDEITIGMALEAVFEDAGELWLPLFKPLPQPAETIAIPSTPAFNKLSSKSQKYEYAAAFTGIGKSTIGRNLGQSGSQLTIDACLKAISDSGLNRESIDGICAYPGSTGIPGLSEGGIREISYHLGLNPSWHMGAQELPGQGGTVSAAVMAIAAGLCTHVLCFTQFAAASPPRPSLTTNTVKGEPRWSLPYGCASPANWIALYANHYFHHYKVDETLLGKLAIAQRQNARLNPDAFYREELDMNTYLASRKITTPFKLLDCDTPCDGAMAFVLSRVDRADDLPQKPVYIESIGTSFSEVQSWDQSTLICQPNVQSASKHLWSRTDFKPADVDVAALYDGFTFNAICWLESLGFCEPGGAADFIGDGSTLSIKGSLPLNPHGGHLNTGRTNGYGHIYEAILQLRGQAGIRQVIEAKTAAVSNGGGIPAGAMLLTNVRK